MKPVKDQLINQYRDRTWIRYPPDQRKHQGNNHDRANAHYRTIVRALDHVDLTKRSAPDKQYNQSRKQRHQIVYDQHQSAKDHIFQLLENGIQNEVEQLKTVLNRNQLEIQSLLTNLTDEVLFGMRFDAFESVWKNVSDLYDDRDRVIAESDANLNSIMDSRVSDLKEAMRATMNQLIDIAFQLQPEIEYVFYQGLLPINVKLIDTKLVLSEFRSRLRIADIRLKQRHLTLYHERRHVWKLLQHDRAVQLQKDKFRSDQYSNPEWRQRIISDLKTCDRRLGASIEHLMSGLNQLSPPILSSSKVMQIQAEVNYVIQTASQISNQCLQSFSDSLQSMEVDMKQQITDLITELNQYSAYESEHINQQIQSQIFFIVDEYHQRFIEESDQISLNLQQQEKLLNERLGAALKFYLSAGRVWENSLKSIDDLEVDTSESWMRRHDLYDDELRSYEDDVKGIMEGLRQASTEAILTETFQQANLILGPSGRIEKCHRTFLQDSLDIARGHLPNLDKVLTNIRSEVNILLKLSAKDTGSDLCLDGADDVQVWAQQIISETTVSTNSDCISTDQVNDNPTEQPPLDTPTESTPQPKPLIVVCQYEFNQPLFSSIIAELRSAFILHTNEISHRERNRVQLLIGERVQEVSVLIDKSLRILAPRIILLNVDIVQIRVNELKENFKRFQRFWDRYDQTFSNGEAAIKSGCTLLEKHISERNTEIERIKEIAAKAQSMQKLQSLHNKSTALSKSFKNRIIAQMKTVKSLQDDLQAQLTQLREQFLASCSVLGSNCGPGTASYHPYELKKYEGEVEILKTESHNRLAEHATLLNQIRDKVESILSQKVTDDVIQKAKADLDAKKGAASNIPQPSK